MSTKFLVLPIVLGLMTLVGACQPSTEVQTPQPSATESQDQSPTANPQDDNEQDTDEDNDQDTDQDNDQDDRPEGQNNE
jgi:UPF0716 family protein affecting phage T7 exclusion